MVTGLLGRLSAGIKMSVIEVESLTTESEMKASQRRQTKKCLASLIDELWWAMMDGNYVCRLHHITYQIKGSC